MNNISIFFSNVHVRAHGEVAKSITRRSGTCIQNFYLTHGLAGHGVSFVATRDQDAAEMMFSVLSTTPTLSDHSGVGSEQKTANKRYVIFAGSGAWLERNGSPCISVNLQ